MTSQVLLYIGSAVAIVWGIAHMVPTRSVVSGFGPISVDNRRILTMEWLAEGASLCFLGVLVLLVTVLAGPQAGAALIVYVAAAAMLLVMAGLTLFTGARTSIVPIKVCPAVKTVAAVLIILGAVL